MPYVEVTGNVRDHMNVPIPAASEPELWFRPLGPQILPASGAMFAGVEVKADLTPATGAFTATLFSDLTPTFRYRPFMRWLVNPGETDPERRAFGYIEWPIEITPDIGGDIGDLILDFFGVANVYAASDAPNPGVRSQIHYNTNTDDIYERVVTW